MMMMMMKNRLSPSSFRLALPSSMSLVAVTSDYSINLRAPRENHKSVIDHSRS
jgi:hypothetical protein